MSQIDLFPSDELKDKIIGGKYKLVEKLSEGGGGVVWTAIDTDGAKIALKFLKWSPLKSRKNAAERFKNEFAILKSLSHPNISKIYDFGLDPETDQYFFTTEHLTEGDLKSLVKGPIPVIEELILQALRSLEYLNNHKLLHLDVKPQNLLLRKSGKHPILALIDFGLATFRSPDKPGGTPNYMPPELIARRLGIDTFSFPPPSHRSDLYSLGVTFYYCLTGVQPFYIGSKDGKQVDAVETLKKHLSHVPPPPSTYREEIPAYLDRIIMKLMARHPDDRYPSAIVAAQALQYSSPRQYVPETKQTLLSYLPKEGKVIGRKAEISTIEEALKAVVDGTKGFPHIICLAGSHGMGRSRILRRTKPLAQQLEMEVHLFDESTPPSQPELENILGLLSHKESKPRAILIDDIDLHIGLKNEDGNSTGVNLLNSIKPLIRKAFFQRRFLSRVDPRMFVLFTVNTEKTEIKDVLSALDVDKSTCRVLELKNFAESEVEEYLSTVLGETPDPSVVKQVKRCTDGNPLFITEQLENMVAKGRLFSLAGRPDAKTLKAIGIDFSEASPSRSLSSSLMKRLIELPGEAKLLAITMACWHRPVNANELAYTDISGSSGKELLSLMRNGIILRDDSDGRFIFPNPLYPSIILDNCDKKFIAKAHDAIAAVLRSRRRTTDSELTPHIAYGSKSSKRLPALEKLSADAMESGKILEGISHLRTMLDLIDHDDWKLAENIIVQIGDAYKRIQNYAEASAYYKRLNKLKAPDSAKLELRLKSCECLGLLEMRRRNLKRAKMAFKEGLKIIGKRKNLTLWKLILENHLAGIELRDGNVEQAIQRFENSASVADRLLSEEERSLITNNELGEALFRKGKTKSALKILKSELKTFKNTDTVDRVANIHYLLGNTLYHDSLKKYDEARSEYLEALKLAKEHHMLNLQVRILNGLGNLELKTSNPKEAMSCYEEGFKLSQQVDSYTTSVELMINMGLASQRLGNVNSTIEYLEAALDFSSGPKGEAAGLIRRFRPTIYVSLGDAYYQKGEYDHALEYLEKAKELDAKERFTPDLRYSLYGTLTEIFLEYEDYGSARSYLPTLKIIAKSFPPAKGHLEQVTRRFPAA